MQELESLVELLGDTPGVGGSNPFVFAHCDLLSGNVIIEPSPSSAAASRRSSDSSASDEPETAAATVSFIDYEYATPAPASFDIANHFAEWGGFDCDYSAMPTRTIRRAFLREYLRSFNAHQNKSYKEEELQELFDQVITEGRAFFDIPEEEKYMRSTRAVTSLRADRLGPDSRSR